VLPLLSTFICFQSAAGFRTAITNSAL